MQSKFWLAWKAWPPGAVSTESDRYHLILPSWESVNSHIENPPDSVPLGHWKGYIANEVTKNNSEHAYCWRRKWQPALEFLPRKSRGRRSLVGAIHGVAGSQTWLSDWERPLLVSVPLSHWTIKYKLKDKIFKNCTRWKGAPLVGRGPCVTAQLRCHEADPDTMRTCIWSKSCQTAYPPISFSPEACLACRLSITRRYLCIMLTPVSFL